MWNEDSSVDLPLLSNNTKDSKKYRTKVAVLGDWSIGKTTMLNCLCGRDLEVESATIGVGFMTQALDIKMEETWENTLYVWDTSGTERYRSIITPYLRHVGIVCIMFDVGDQTTWKHVDHWRDLALKQAEITFKNDNDTLPLICLVGCQADKENHAVSVEEIEKKAAEWKCPWWKVSTRKSLKLQGTLPHVLLSQDLVGSASAAKAIRLVENPHLKSVWASFLHFTETLTPKEQILAVFGHMAVEFHRLARRVGYNTLNYETCSLGPVPEVPTIVVIDRPTTTIKLVSGDVVDRKPACCE
jgi:small GTP-binding protein